MICLVPAGDQPPPPPQGTGPPLANTKAATESTTYRTVTYVFFAIVIPSID
jgi:hypothetical protein